MTRVAPLTSVLLLAGCSFHMQEMGQPAQGSRFQVWGRPALGEYLCLSATPGTPVYAQPPDSPMTPQLIGYTKNLVAFKGWQDGNEIAIVYYTGGVGWIDARNVTPYQPTRPGERCIVPGLDRNLRPIFEID